MNINIIHLFYVIIKNVKGENMAAYKGIAYMRRKLANKRLRVDTRYRYYEMKEGVQEVREMLPPAYRWMILIYKRSLYPPRSVFLYCITNPCKMEQSYAILTDPL